MFRLALSLFTFGSLVLAEDLRAETQLPRTNLFLYHRASGEIASVRSRSDWQKRRAEILRHMQQIMGPLPTDNKRCPLDIKISEQVDCGTYIRQLLTFASEPGSRTPAYLLIPKDALHSQRKYSAILALHPTDMEFGHRVVVEEMRKNYRAYARDLAERGYVVIAPAYPLMANYQPDLKALGYSSGTMKAIWDNIRALDLLDSLPYTKKNRIGAIGHSLGGHNAIFTAVFDPRMKAIVSSCGFDSFVDYYDGNIKGWTSERYMPKLMDFAERLHDIPFDFHELLGALAPRPVFINSPLHDSNFKWQSVDHIVRAAQPVYDLYHASKNLRVYHPDSAHDFPPAIRAAAYEFLDRALK